MTDLERGWLAGIIEGEGYCKWKPGGGSSQGQAKLTIQMTDRDVMERVANLLECNLCTSPPKGKNKQVWRVSIKSWDKVENIVTDLLPLMGDRRATDMQIILEKAELRRQWIQTGGRKKALERTRTETGTWV